MSASLRSRSVGSVVAPTFRSVTMTRTGPPFGILLREWMPSASRRIPHSGSSAISTSASRWLIGRIPAGEFDAGCFTDQTAPAIAPDQILGSQRMAVGQLDVDASVVLREAGHLASAIDWYGQLFDPAGQDAFDMLLPESEPVVVPGRKVADVQRDVGESAYLHRLALREKTIGDPALIENLDRAGVQATRARADQLRLARRSTIATSTPANVSSPANIIPVGPPPAITTACSVIATLRSTSAAR